MPFEVSSVRGGAGPMTRRGAKSAPVGQAKSAPVVESPPIGGSATVSSEIFNLVKALVGVGVLSLPAGIAAFADAPSALIPAVALITVIGILSGFGFSIIGRVCAYTGAVSYRDAWSRSVGPKSSWIPAWSTTLKTFLACLAFSMILADTFCSLLQSTHRTLVLIGISVCILLPLCWMKNLSSLAPFSLAGALGMAYTAVAMAVRWLDRSYSKTGNHLFDSIPQHLRPSFGSAGLTSIFQPSSLILVCMLSTAYMAHFNAPKFYSELQNNTLQRYNKVVASSFGLSILLVAFITSIGFLTFGRGCAGLVLNNYATKDSWMSISRVAVAVSLVFSYPLAFQGFRDGTLDLLQISHEKRSDVFLNVTTVLLLSLLTLGAATVKDVSFALAFGGATLGNALTYVYPALMYRAIVKKQDRKDQSFGVTVASLSAILGTAMGAIGAKMAMSA